MLCALPVEKMCCLLQEVHRACYVKFSGTTVCYAIDVYILCAGYLHAG